MRRSFRPTFIYTDDLYNTNKHIIVGMDLSCGYCAEHERGIQCLQNLYHLTPFMFHNKPYVLQSYEKTNFYNEKNRLLYKPIFGFDSRQIHYVSNQMQIWKRKQYNMTFYYMIGADEYIYNYYDTNINKFPRELFLSQSLYKERYPELATAWSNCDFGIMGTKEYLQSIVDMYISFKQKDIVICYGYTNNKVKYDGLVFFIRSMLSKSMEQKQKELDEINYELHIKTEDLNIREILDNIGIKYSNDINAIYADDEHTKILWFINTDKQWYSLLYSYEQLKEMEYIHGSYNNKQ